MLVTPQAVEEGSAADGRVLKDAISRENGLKVPTGFYYLCDAGVISSSHNNFPRPPDLPMMPSHDSNKERRTWTHDEEAALIAIMKKLVADGYRQENAFRSGYLEIIEKQLKVWFPGTDLNLTNVSSKLTVWKRQYYLMMNMINTSGFGWNDSSNMIAVEDDVWKQYAKSFRYFQDWIEIFGKDHATGKRSQDSIDLDKVARKQQASIDLAKVASQQSYLPHFDVNEFSTGLNVHTQDDSFSNNNENIDHELPLEEEVADTPFPGESNSINSTKGMVIRKLNQKESAIGLNLQPPRTRLLLISWINSSNNKMNQLVFSSTNLINEVNNRRAANLNLLT
ncbi:poly(ADP-ribose) glycohydrolase [Salvia divinorum]|uniref:Poly(ADP-ribose) glycohydrolase n=1 Tax=Salvia divinorum TaxID=28513 RepID=A0ABD1IP55_SALDI